MTTTTATSGALAAAGIGSGLDVNGIVSKLMSVESAPLTALATKEASFQAKITAYGSLKGAVATLQASLNSLLDAKNLLGVSAALVDASVASVAAGSTAVPGSYSFQVSKLAQAQKLASTGFATTTESVGTGTLTFDFGTTSGNVFTSSGAGAKTVTIAANQSSLAGVRDAVNAAGIGVTAAIVNDGGTLGSHIVFTSSSTGAAKSLKITVADNDGTNTNTSGLSQLAYDPAAPIDGGKNLSQKAEAQDAAIIVDGMTISSSTNVFSDAIQGLTITASKESAGVATKLTVEANTSALNSGIQGFVSAYNNLLTTISSLTKYDTATKKGSVLTGDSAARSLQTQLRSFLSNTSGISGTYTKLSEVGLGFSANGSLSINSTKLSDAIKSDAAAVARLFGAAITASDSMVSPSIYGTKTSVGTYALNISQLATHGAATGSAALTDLVIAENVNDSLTATVDGTSVTVKLAVGTYVSASALATEVQAKINGVLTLGKSITTTLSQPGGVLTLTSAAFGSTSAVSVGGTAVTTLFGAGGVTVVSGNDVAGTIGGVIGSGSGQTLLAAPGLAGEGLSIKVVGGSVGDRGTVTYSKGFAPRMSALLTSMLGSDGPIASRTEGLNRTIKDIGQQREARQQRLVQVEAKYRAQFNSLDTLLAGMNAASSQLTTQLSSLPGVVFKQTDK